MNQYKINSLARKVKYLREASDVQRVHSLRKIGEYTVGQHTFNMLTMLRLTYPDARPELIWAIVNHDLPERLTGDFPAPAKWAGIVNNEVETYWEQHILTELYGDIPELTPDEFKILKSLDILEIYLWNLDQIALGNSTMQLMKARVEAWVLHNAHELDSKILDLYYMCNSSPWTTMPDLGETDVSK